LKSWYSDGDFDISDMGLRTPSVGLWKVLLEDEEVAGVAGQKEACQLRLPWARSLTGSTCTNLTGSTYTTEFNTQNTTECRSPFPKPAAFSTSDGNPCEITAPNIEAPVDPESHLCDIPVESERSSGADDVYETQSIRDNLPEQRYGEDFAPRTPGTVQYSVSLNTPQAPKKAKRTLNIGEIKPIPFNIEQVPCAC